MTSIHILQSIYSACASSVVMNSMEEIRGLVLGPAALPLMQHAVVVNTLASNQYISSTSTFSDSCLLNLLFVQTWSSLKPLQLLEQLKPLQLHTLSTGQLHTSSTGQLHTSSTGQLHTPSTDSSTAHPNAGGPLKTLLASWPSTGSCFTGRIPDPKSAIHVSSQTSILCLLCACSCLCWGNVVVLAMGEIGRSWPTLLVALRCCVAHFCKNCGDS